MNIILTKYPEIFSLNVGYEKLKLIMFEECVVDEVYQMYGYPKTTEFKELKF